MEEGLSWSEYKKLFVSLMDDNGEDFEDEEVEAKVMKKLKSAWKKEIDVEEIFDSLFQEVVVRSLQTFKSGSMRDLMILIEKYADSNSLEVLHFSVTCLTAERYEALVLFDR